METEFFARIFALLFQFNSGKLFWDTLYYLSVLNDGVIKSGYKISEMALRMRCDTKID